MRMKIKAIITSFVLMFLGFFCESRAEIAKSVEELHGMVGRYQSAGGDEGTRRDIVSLLQTGNYKDKQFGLNLSRMATPAERLIMIEAVITSTLVPDLSWGILDVYQHPFLVAFTDRRNYDHQLALYTIAKLAEYEMNGGFQTFEKAKEFIDYVTEATLNPSCAVDMWAYVSDWYENPLFQTSFERALGRPVSGYSPRLLKFKREKEEERTAGLWRQLREFNALDFNRDLRLGSSFYGSVMRRNLPSERAHGLDTPIYYDMLASEDVLSGRKEAKGVVIEVYGGDDVEISHLYNTPQTFSQLMDQHVLAKEGYIVYLLFPRGSKTSTIGVGKSKGNGGDFKQEGTEGIFTLVRDVAYFAALLKSDSTLTHLPAISGMRERPSVQNAVEGHDRIKGKKIPIILTGASFGGMLALMTATSNEPITYREGGKDKTETIAEIFDAYIPKAAYIDLWEDAESSPTELGQRRHWDVSRAKWFTSAFPLARTKDASTYLDEASLSPYSIYSRLPNVKRPILVLHGLNDNNTTPQSAMNLVQKSWTAGVQHFVSLCFEGEIGHFMGVQESTAVDQGRFKLRDREFKKYFERQFRFLDVVRFAKQQGQVFHLSHNDAVTTHALAQNAPMLMATYSTNPAIHSPFERFMGGLVKSIWRGNIEHDYIKADSVLEQVSKNNTHGGAKGLPTMLVAALLDLKSRERNNDFHDIDVPLFNIKYFWYGAHKSWLEEAFQVIFPISPAASSATGAVGLPTSPSHVLDHYSAWENTCLKNPDADGCGIDPRPYLACLKDPTKPECAAPKIALFCTKMKESSPYVKFDYENPLEKVKQILNDRMTKPEYAYYRDAVHAGQDAFATPILNGRFMF